MRSSILLINNNRLCSHNYTRHRFPHTRIHPHRTPNSILFPSDTPNSREGQSPDRCSTCVFHNWILPPQL